MKPVNLETRQAMVLQREVDRMWASAERVRLLTQAIALRHGLRPTKVTQEDIDFAG